MYGAGCASGCLAGLGIPLVSFFRPVRQPGSSGAAWRMPVPGSGLGFPFRSLLASGEDTSLVSFHGCIGEGELTKGDETNALIAIVMRLPVLPTHSVVWWGR